MNELNWPVASAGEAALWPTVCPAWLDACMPVCAAAWATASAAAAGAAGEAPIGAIGGGTAKAAVNALRAPEYAQPTPELCGQCSPKYSPSRSTIPGVFWPNQGVWAGVKLPGGQYRKREQLAHAHEVLRRIAAGEINARELPENAALLASRERELETNQLPLSSVILHLPAAKVGPRSAA
ncbi:MULTISPECIES: hypothetical protein [Mycobacterium]|uniref:hypothetical protein n=1 Tax=Mycobacterium TaxID=1763 RepID=UPI002740E610|nr:hypothetical protein [Mycobacterium sp. TY813]